jgi:hypothetical protein
VQALIGWARRLSTAGLNLSNRSTTVVRIGGATGEPPLAAAVLDKLSGPVPLTVNINMSGSTDDGTISNYYIGCGGYFAPAQFESDWELPVHDAGSLLAGAPGHG